LTRSFIAASCEAGIAARSSASRATVSSSCSNGTASTAYKIVLYDTGLLVVLAVG
jgi:hypothetical protein